MWEPPYRVLFESPMARIGTFRCATGHPSFEDSGPARNYCFVFPRTAVAIEHEDQRAFAANPNVVTFYNLGQSYRRHAISPEGDRCDWFAVPAEVARSAVREFDAHPESRPERPFRLQRGWSDPAAYLMQRRLFKQIQRGAVADPLFVEEQVMLLLHRVLRSTYQRTPKCVAQRDAIHHVEVMLSERLDKAVRLAELAAASGLSAYHLCRTFRRMTGTSLHQYRRRLRLLWALEPVCDSRQPLIDIALSAGFSSHSHFTSSFRRQFGRSPSDLR